MLTTTGEFSELPVATTVGATGSDNALPTEQAVREALTALIPAGTMVIFGGTSAPSGWLLCDGSAYSRTTYAALFAAIDTRWGVGDGSTTFNIPDLRGRAPIGAGQGNGLTNRTLGSNLGEESHALTLAENGTHTHTGGLHAHTGGEHNHKIATSLSDDNGGRVHCGAAGTAGTAANSASGGAVATTYDGAVATTSSGSGTAQTARDLGASVLLSSGTDTGQVLLTSGKVDVNDKTGFALSSAGVQAIWDALSSALTTVGSIGKRLVDYLTGDAYARLGAPAGASVSADIASIKTDTGTTIPGRLPAALVGGRMDAYVGAMAANVLDSSALATSAVAEIQTGLSTLDAAGVRTALGLASANLDTQLGALATAAALSSVALSSVASTASAIKLQTDNLPADPADQSAVEAAIAASLTTSLAESYRTAGATGSVAQLLYELVAHAGEAVISGTTKTINKLDHVTPAATFTLDDATNPSSITRAT